MTGSQENDLASSPGKSVNGSFRKFRSGANSLDIKFLVPSSIRKVCTNHVNVKMLVLVIGVALGLVGFLRSDFDSSPGQSLDGSFRKPNSGL
ncbi:hypothetical protein Patl1_28156 [Pistacia atlantica]|uniref:Uncharacterized protein n=1 Tax=Pistacia atlantica TaxID=434234 RepID=A0ACC1BG47_9ROSI|nr:hypothetical protein Patl1_28156 [Pistacia atlantica]